MRAKTRLVRASATVMRAPQQGLARILIGCSPIAVAAPTYHISAFIFFYLSKLTSHTGKIYPFWILFYAELFNVFRFIFSIVVCSYPITKYVIMRLNCWSFIGTKLCIELNNVNFITVHCAAATALWLTRFMWGRASGQKCSRVSEKLPRYTCRHAQTFITRQFKMHHTDVLCKSRRQIRKVVILKDGVLASEGWWEAWQPSPKVTRSC